MTWNNLGAFSVSESGVLAHHPGGPIVTEQRLTWRDRAGRVTADLGETGRFPTLDLSPDGTRVAVSVVKGGAASDIWIIDLARGDGVPVTSDPAWEFDPSWSHDGRRLVFNSNRSEGRVNLFMRASDGSGQRRIGGRRALDRRDAGLDPRDPGDRVRGRWRPVDSAVRRRSAAVACCGRRRRGREPEPVAGRPVDRVHVGQDPGGRRSTSGAFRPATPNTRSRSTEAWPRDGAVTARRSFSCRWMPR